MYNNFDEYECSSNISFSEHSETWGPLSCCHNSKAKDSRQSEYEKWQENGLSVPFSSDNESKNMSILIAEIVDNSIIMMSDSRSTEIVGGQYPHQKYDDNYKKIIYFPDSNLILGSTGLNNFGGRNLKELSQNVYNSVKRTGKYLSNTYDFVEMFIGKLNEEILEYVRKCNSSVTIIYGFFKEVHKNLMGVDAKTFEPHIYSFRIQMLSPNFNFLDVVLENQPLFFGDDFTIEILKRVYVPKENDVTIHYNHYKSAMQKIITLEDELFTNSVIGGSLASYVIDEKGLIAM